MGLTPEHVYRASALLAWENGGKKIFSHLDLDAYVELMLARPDWRALVGAAYWDGREDAARAVELMFEDRGPGRPIPGTVVTPQMVRDWAVAVARGADRPTGQGNQPRTASQGDGDDPEEQRP